METDHGGGVGGLWHVVRWGLLLGLSCILILAHLGGGAPQVVLRDSAARGEAHQLLKACLLRRLAHLSISCGSMRLYNDFFPRLLWRLAHLSISCGKVRLHDESLPRLLWRLAHLSVCCGSMQLCDTLAPWTACQ